MGSCSGGAGLHCPLDALVLDAHALTLATLGPKRAVTPESRSAISAHMTDMETFTGVKAVTAETAAGIEVTLA